SKLRASNQRNLIYDVPLADGSYKQLQLTGRWTGLVAHVDGYDLPLERKLQPWEMVLVFLPLAALVGGLIGGVFGGIGVVVNYGIARSGLGVALRAPLMIGVAIGAALLWLVVAVLTNS